MTCGLIDNETLALVHQPRALLVLKPAILTVHLEDMVHAAGLLFYEAILRSALKNQ
jgi:hypothetical protein